MGIGMGHGKMGLSEEGQKQCRGENLLHCDLSFQEITSAKTHIQDSVKGYSLFKCEQSVILRLLFECSDPGLGKSGLFHD